MLWAKAELVEIEPELNEIIFTEADSAARHHMEDVNAQIRSALEQQFPELRQDLTPKYNKVFNQIRAQIPYIDTLIRVNLDRTSDFWSIAGLLAFLLVGGVVFAVRSLFLRRRRMLQARA